KIDSQSKAPIEGVIFEIKQGENIQRAETNSRGQAIIQMEYGEYEITEVNTPEGYEGLEEPITIEFTSEGNKVITNPNSVNVTVNENGEYVVENKKLGQVIVHHYLDNTTTKIA